MKFTRQERNQIRAHLECIMSIADNYKKTSEPFDQIDKVTALVAKIEKDLSE